MRRRPSRCRRLMAGTAWRRPRICSGPCSTKWISFSTTEGGRAMNAQEKFNRFVSRYPHVHTPFFARPHATRRRFFQLLGGAVTGSVLSNRLASAANITSIPVNTINKAKNVIFILLTGAPSHTDTFDFKFVDGVTPA